MLRKGFAVRIAAVVMAVAATPLWATAAHAAPIISPFELEVITIPNGIAGTECLGLTQCTLSNSATGSTCSEIEIENPGLTPLDLGEGSDPTPCHVFLDANLTVLGCSVSGSGTLTFTEDVPSSGAAGGTFAFQLRGTAEAAVMEGAFSPGTDAEDAIAGEMTFNTCSPSSATPALYKATTVFVALPPTLGG